MFGYFYLKFSVLHIIPNWSNQDFFTINVFL